MSPEKGNALDGVAVISAIVSASDPEAAARQLSAQVTSFKRAHSFAMPPFTPFAPSGSGALAQMLETVGELLHTVRKTTPLVHQITNSVVVNDSANVTLAVGASPIMATNARDCVDLSTNIGALLINSGTITDETLKGMLAAGSAANVNGKPVVWDPVAVGATAFRRETGQRESPMGEQGSEPYADWDTLTRRAAARLPADRDQGQRGRDRLARELDRGVCAGRGQCGAPVRPGGARA